MTQHQSIHHSLPVPMVDSLWLLPINVLEYITLFLDTLSIACFAKTCHHYNYMTESVAIHIQFLLKQTHYHSRLFQTFMKGYRDNEKLVLHNLIQSKILVIRGFVAYTYHPILNTWIKNPDLRRDRSYFSMLWLKGEVYSIGTYSVIASGTAERYNPISNVWSSIEAMPEKIRSFSSCTWNNDTIVITGGEDVFSNDLSSLILTYKSTNDNTRSNGWKIHGSRLVYPRYGHASIAYENSIWIAGGIYRDHHTQTKDVSLWNPLTNQWILGPSLCKGRSHFNLYVIHNLLYAVGGDYHHDNHNPDHVESTIEVLDKDHQSWSILTTIPFPRIGYSSCVYRHSIYVFGGNIIGSNTWDRYDISSNTWESAHKRTGHDMPALPSNGQALLFPPEHLTW